MIWKLCLSPRLIRPHWNHSPYPVVHHINKESRKETMKGYEVVGDTTLPHPAEIVSFEHDIIYISNNQSWSITDNPLTVYLSHIYDNYYMEVMGRLKYPACEKIRRVAISTPCAKKLTRRSFSIELDRRWGAINSPAPSFTKYGCFWERLSFDCPELKELIIVLDGDEGLKYEDLLDTWMARPEDEEGSLKEGILTEHKTYAKKHPGLEGLKTTFMRQKGWEGNRE